MTKSFSTTRADQQPEFKRLLLLLSTRQIIMQQRGIRQPRGGWSFADLAARLGTSRSVVQHAWDRATAGGPGTFDAEACARIRLGRGAVPNYDLVSPL